MTAPLKVTLLGAHAGTGNLGVSALAEGAVHGVLAAAPGAVITVLADVRQPGLWTVIHMGQAFTMPVVPFTYSKRIFRPDHLGMLVIETLAARVGPKGLRDRLSARVPAFAALAGADVVLDLSGGDSFTDSYGPYRMFLQTLIKTAGLAGCPRYVLLPQTVGPFRSRLSRIAARAVLRRAAAVYVRDEASVDETRRLVGAARAGRVRFAPDVSLLVEPVAPPAGAPLPQAPGGGVTVGLNVSGFLWEGGYRAGGAVRLASDYRSLVERIARSFLDDPEVRLILVPHVQSRAWGREDDLRACERLEAALGEPDRVAVAGGLSEPGHAKFVIGGCDFFVGARMHACVAALSQGVPAVAVAYSGKFDGVFESLGAGGLVADARGMGEDAILSFVMKAFAARRETAVRLRRAVPEAKDRLRDMFAGLLGLSPLGAPAAGLPLGAQTVPAP